MILMPRDTFGPWPPKLAPFPFRFRDPLTGKWTGARYRTERGVIASQYREWEITGPPEIRGRYAAGFSPWRVLTR